MECYLCKKHAGELGNPPGGYIYQVVLLEGVQHFHAWILPRTKEIPERGIAFLQKNITCEETSAQKLATALRMVLN